MSNHQEARVWILCARKTRGNSSWTLYRELQRLGVNCYRVTAGTNPRYSPSRVHTIINWGVSRPPIWESRLPEDVRWFNTTLAVSISANKRLMQEQLGECGLPWTHNKFEAESWIDTGKTVVSRGILNGSQGRGITLSPPDQLPNAELYTQLIEKRDGGSVREYRVYIVDGKAIDITEKRRMRRERREELGIDARDPYTRLIRAHRNGWVFARNTMQATAEQCDTIKRCAEVACKTWIGIGGADMIVRYHANGEIDDIYTVETNTQVGISGDGTTAAILAEALKEVL